MDVQLIDYTGAGTNDPARYAAELLAFTKATRLEMGKELANKINAMPLDELYAELYYMARTIPSSWEFVSYTFLIRDVTRAFTHQFVRTRTGSYAQQSMRVTDQSGFNYRIGPGLADLDAPGRDTYIDAMEAINEAYGQLIAEGVDPEDARGILPTNIYTNIVAKFSLRTFVEMARKRASLRTQDEYREVMELMKGRVIAVHPWTAMFLERTKDAQLHELSDRIRREVSDKKAMVAMVKLVDELRAG